MKQNVRRRDAYLVQSTVFPTNGNFLELLFQIDAFKRASAASVTVLIPYFSCAKGDKKDAASFDQGQGVRPGNTKRDPRKGNRLGPAGT